MTARERTERRRATWRRYARRHYEQNRRRIVEADYGIPYAEYQSIIARGCEVCGTHEGRICLDHDHGTGKLRGALCHRCNAALGMLDDNPNRLRAALAYLAR